MLLALTLSLLFAPQELTSQEARALAETALKPTLQGASVGIMRDGKTILADGFGVRGVDSKEAVAADTRFAIGSVTKQFTAACIMKLADDGKLKVTDKLDKYLPSMTDAAKVSLLDLMSHQAGYRDYFPLDFIDRRMMGATSAQRVADTYGKMPLDFEPGTRWSYSNTNYIILGLVMEKVSGMPLARFMQTRVFDPLHMKNTVFMPEARDKKYALGTMSVFLGPPEPAVEEARGWVGAAGAIWSTAEDMLKWDLALMEGKVMSPSSFATYTEPRTTKTGSNTGYACGWLVGISDGNKVLQHDGAVGGFVAQNILYPANKSALVVLQNRDLGNQSPVVRALLPRIRPKAGSDVPPASTSSEPAAPKINVAGKSDQEVAADLIGQLAKGILDRSNLGEEYSYYLSTSRLEKIKSALTVAGPIKTIRVSPAGERGGMSVSVVQVEFPDYTARGLMYRSPDGKVQELLLLPR